MTTFGSRPKVDPGLVWLWRHTYIPSTRDVLVEGVP
jgi:hypothetical protein